MQALNFATTPCQMQLDRLPELLPSQSAVRTCAIPHDHGGAEPELLGVGGDSGGLDDVRAGGHAEAGAVRLQLGGLHDGGHQTGRACDVTADRGRGSGVRGRGLTGRRRGGTRAAQSTDMGPAGGL